MIAGLAALILIKIAFMAIVFVLVSMISVSLGCATSSLVDLWGTSNYDTDFVRYIEDHTIALQDGEVERLRALDLSDYYWRSQENEFTVLQRPGAEGSVTFALYEKNGRGRLFVSPLAFRDICSPLDLTLGAPWVAHVSISERSIHYSDRANRDYSWRFGERRARN